ncbi:MAG: hypothetical protein CM1200mP29_15510 [Verrucomicrobiota bacterium]|nr:MAG: hypothetical protein CM1200mP29_15510 [Verrucomicrobiota bacterium]
MSDKIVPLISSGTKGPLGVCTCPAFGRKFPSRPQENCRRLPGNWRRLRHNGNQRTRPNADAVRACIPNDKPTYPQFEAWIREQDGATLDAVPSAR